MPISEYFGGHGEEVKKNMTKEYGAKKGEQVFYATANKRNEKPAQDAGHYADEHKYHVDRMTELRRVKPRPIEKLFGSNGPTPEQKAKYDAEVKAWNSAYNKSAREAKRLLPLANEEFRKSQGRDVLPVGTDPQVGYTSSSEPGEPLEHGMEELINNLPPVTVKVDDVKPIGDGGEEDASKWRGTSTTQRGTRVERKSSQSPTVRPIPDPGPGEVQTPERIEAQREGEETNKIATDEHVGFKKLEGELSHEKGVKDPGAVAAAIGRKKYGEKAMAAKSAAGRASDRRGPVLPI